MAKLYSKQFPFVVSKGELFIKAMVDGPISNKALCFVWWQKINEQTGLTFPAGRTLIWRPSEDPHCPVYPANNG